MKEKFIKRGYNFPIELIAEWEKFHSPYKDFSPSASAAFLLYMVIEPALREELKRLSVQENIHEAKIEARKLIRETIINAYWSGFVKTPEDKILLMERFFGKTEGQKISKKIEPKTLKNALRDFVQSAKTKDQMPAEIIKIEPSDDALWAALRELAGFDKEGKKAKEG